MNIEDVAQRINRPELCTKEDVKDLESLIERYPYAQSFPLLLLKILGQSGDLGFEDQLNKYAYRVSDRMRLYELIHQEEVFVEEEISSEEPDASSIMDEANENETETLEVEETVVAENEILQPESEEANEAIEILEEPIVKEEKLDESAPVVEEVNTLIEGDLEEEVLLEESEILEEEWVPVSESDVEQEELESIPAVEIPLDIRQTEDPVLDVTTSEALAQSFHLTLEKEEDVPVEKIEKEVPSVQLSEKRSFSAWLKVSSETTSLAELTPAPKKKEEEIIEKFIQTEPKITRHKADETEEPKKKTSFFNPVETGKKSIDENGMPVSETLAKIFEAQGHYPKAIQVYQQLSLLFPEKKIFFADQIQKLEQKSNR